MSENAGARSGEEVLKLRFEFFKHMTTVSTASTAAVIAVYGLSEKMLRVAAVALGLPDWVILFIPGCGIVGFFFSLLLSLLGMYFIVDARPTEGAAVWSVRLLRLSAATFILGVGISAVTAGLIVAGPQIAAVFLSLAGILIIILIIILTYFGVKAGSNAIAGAQRLVATYAGDTTPPLVVSTNPRDKDEDAPPDIHPTATFSKPMDSVSINPDTFKVLRQGALPEPVPARVADGVVYAETTGIATFIPAQHLENGRTYTAIITASVKDQAGNTLAQDHTWHFTVGRRP